MKRNQIASLALAGLAVLIGSSALAETLIKSQGNPAEQINLTVKSMATGEGFSCRVTFAGREARIGSLEFSSFGKSEVSENSLIRRRYDVQKTAEYQRMLAVVNSLSSQSKAERTLDEPENLVEYSVLTKPQDSPVQKAHNLYSVDPTKRFDTWNLSAIADTEPNRIMIQNLNSVCERARIAFNKTNPEAKVNSLGREAEEALAPSKVESFFKQLTK